MGCGIKVDQHRKFIGEIGYFVDEKYWGKGIATGAVRMLEKIGFLEFGLKRLEIFMEPENKASERAAIKCGYVKEGFLRKTILTKGEYRDGYLYGKVV